MGTQRGGAELRGELNEGRGGRLGSGEADLHGGRGGARFGASEGRRLGVPGSREEWG
jgi:hypothetical protein